MIASLLKAPLNFASWKLKLIAVGVIVVLFSGWTYGAIRYGRNAEQTEIAQEQAKERAKELAALAIEIQERKPVIEKATKRRAETSARVNEGRRLLDEAIKNAGDKPACDLTDDELRAYEQILGTQKD